MKKYVIFLIFLFLYSLTAIASQSLPPDPGQAGKLTLLGIDIDSDGVRDDIQRYIYFTYPDNEKARTALTHIAIQFQKLLQQANDREASKKQAIKMARHGECLDYIMGEAAGDVIAALQAEIINSEERSLAYISFNDNLAGTVIFGAPLKEWKNSCAFNVDAVSEN